MERLEYSTFNLSSDASPTVKCKKKRAHPVRCYILQAYSGYSHSTRSHTGGQRVRVIKGPKIDVLICRKE
ncbi:hypothetical protein PM082_013611 [Marasmius tenuissimus]|nr:hypothetical protein PM082_013611 [Marasmius tenuissimus]